MRRGGKVTDKMDAAGLAWAIYDGVGPTQQLLSSKKGSVYSRIAAGLPDRYWWWFSTGYVQSDWHISNNPEFADVRSLEGLSPTINPVYRFWQSPPQQALRQK